MAHLRERWLKKQLLTELNWSPVVGIFGLRQVGKTTLVKEITALYNGEIETFDREITKQSAQANPVAFCTRAHLLTIDEVQRVPKVFFAIKEIIGTQRKARQFLLTGSIRFTLKKEVQEALTGRILLNELLPFNPAEIKKITQSSFLKSAFEAALKPESTRKIFANILQKSSQRLTKHDLDLFQFRGGLPLSCFTRDDRVRKKWFDDYFETLLSRDLPLTDEALASITIRQGLQMLQNLALHQGKEISISDLADSGSIRLLLAKKFLRALELLCLIEPIFPIKKARTSTRKPRYEWKDIGLWNHISSGLFTGLEHEITLRLALSQEFRSQLAFESKMVQCNFYKTHNLSTIPWIFKKGEQVVCMITVLTESPRPYDYRALRQFIEKEKKAIGIVLSTRNSNVVQLCPRIWMMPYHCVF